MAISHMLQLSLLLPKELLDDLLFYLQGLQSVQIHDLREQEDWQTALGNQTVSGLTMPAAQQELLKRQEKLEKMIERLESYLPKKKLLQSLKEKPLELSFEQLEQQGQARDEALLLSRIDQELRKLAQAEERIKADQAELVRLEKWEPLEATPQDLAAFSHLKGLVGTIPSKDNDALRTSLQLHPDLQVEVVFSSATEQGLLIFYRAGSLEEVQSVLAQADFKPFDYEGSELPRQHIRQLRADMEEQETVCSLTRAALAASKQELAQLQLQLDYVLNLSSRQQSKDFLAGTQNLVALEAWVESEQLAELQDCLNRQFGQAILVESREAAADEAGQVPTKLKNPALIEPFELVTEMYALPKYGEKDPTPIVALFYFVFFGMMVADIGYGLLLLLGTCLALRFFSVKPGLAKNLRFFRLLSFAVIIWGVVYGSFLGFELPFALIRTSSDAMTILVLSVLFGFITVVAGLYLSGLKNLRVRDYAEAYTSGFAWVLILLGLLLLVLGRVLPSLPLLGPVGQWLALLNALGILAVSLVSAKSFSGLAAGLFNLYNVSGYVGDLVSFTRLMALGLSGASIGSAFNLIVSLFPPLARFTIGLFLFIALHLINMFLSFLSGYVHGARLIFVEFFGKFYDGGGKPFRPLKPAEKYVKDKKEI
ncbi:V-type ATP synthase subunit I [Streptococcus panodentis]|uniref:V-type ATP synthase subunit I n=1 Tax=Streptococcus panodentis TaxID=1581472 RepID=A0ABS5AWQ8_9STRE|nr:MULTISPECIES: V-type ATP synthase subunit I [Streptococcus]KXT77545.1 V-type ATP synthase subunit I [Streptococcus sp. DD11]MBP2621014.1 V-type ATP synthase subunit I [Streptococcus panodentis]